MCVLKNNVSVYNSLIFFFKACLEWRKLWANTALLMWKTPQEVELQMVKMMMTSISLDLMMRRYGINWYKYIVVLKHRLCSLIAWIWILASFYYLPFKNSHWLHDEWNQITIFRLSSWWICFFLIKLVFAVMTPLSLSWGTTSFVKWIKFSLYRKVKKQKG